MPRILRIAILTLALVAAATSWPRAQGGAGQKPPDPKPAAAADGDAQKPAEPAEELPADAKAFNAAAGEKNPLKRVEALEKFIADNPKAAPMLLSMARSQITSSALAAFKDSRAKYLALAEKDVADAAKRMDTMPLYFTYNRLASALVTAGIFSEEAEDYARKGLAAMDERAYMESRKQQYERSLAAFEKRTASAAGAKPESAQADDAPAPSTAASATPAAAATLTPAAAAPATPADAAKPAAPAPAAPPAPNYRFATRDGVMQASLASPASASQREARRNLAEGCPVKASSVLTKDGTTYRAEFAVDGNPDTRWSSEFSEPQWLAVDLGETQTISRVVLLWEAAFARAYAIQVSQDGETWQEAYATTTGTGKSENVRFAPRSARWVRLHTTKRATEYGISLFELGVYH